MIGKENKQREITPATSVIDVARSDAERRQGVDFPFSIRRCNHTMTKKGGYIKLYRILDPNQDELFNAEPLCKWAAWVDLIMQAEYRNSIGLYRGVKVERKRGTVYTSLRQLAGRWHWSINKVKRFLKTLEEQGKTNTQKNNVISCVSILNYNKYQTDEYTDEYTEKTCKSNDFSELQSSTPNECYPIRHTECITNGDTERSNFAKNEYNTKNIRKKEYKKENSPSSSPARTCEEEINSNSDFLENDFYQELKADQNVKERSCMNLHITMEQYDKLLDEFASECTIKQTYHDRGRRDYYSHAFDWMRKHLQIQREQEEREKVRSNGYNERKLSPKEQFLRDYERNEEEYMRTEGARVANTLRMYDENPGGDFF